MSDKIEVLDADKNEAIVKTKDNLGLPRTTRTPKKYLDKRQENSLREDPETGKIIDARLVRKLAQFQCTYSEIAAACNCSASFLVQHYKNVIDVEKENGKKSLRRKMFENALDNNNTQMQIWLSKNELGYVDRSEVKSDTTLTINVAE